MVADKSIPMFDPDNQWVDRKFVKEFMRSYRLSPETIGKMMCKPEAEEWKVGAFEFRVRKAFVDVTDPEGGTHYVHAYWETFMSIVEAVASEPPDPNPTTKDEKELTVLKAALQTFVSVVATRVHAGMSYADCSAVSQAARVFLDNM